MSLRKNINQQSDQYINDGYSQHQINDKSCQKQLFQCRNLNVQNGLPGDNSLIQSYVDAAEHQINTDQFSVIQAIDEKNYEFKEDMQLNLQSNNQEIQHSDICQYNYDKRILNKLQVHEINGRCINNLQDQSQNDRQQINKQNVNTFQQNNQIDLKISSYGSRYTLDEQKNKQYTRNGLNLSDKYFRIVQRLKNFSKKCRANSNNIRQMLLTDELINSEIQLNQSSNTCIKNKLFNQLINQINNLSIIAPFSKSLIIWDSFSLIYLSTYYYFLSILIFFDFQPAHSQSFISFCIITLFILLIDIIILLNTAYIKEEAIVKERKKIIQKYIFSYHFFSDFVSAISLLLKISAYSCLENPSFSQLCVFNCLIFLKLYALQIKKQNIENYFANKFYLNSAYEVTKNVGFIFIAAHIGIILIYLIFIYQIYCKYLLIKAPVGWYVQTKVYSLYYPEGVTWAKQLQIQDEVFYVKYFYSFYWAISTLSTVGNYSFCAQNSLELLYISLSILAFVIIYVYSVSNMGFAFWNVYEKNGHFQKNIFLINNYLKNCKIDSQLEFKVKEYLSVFSECLKSPKYNQQESILNIIPKNLRDQIALQCNMGIIQSFDILKQFSEKSQNKFAFLIQELILSPGQLLFQEGDIQDNSIYFIKRGCIQIYQQQQENNSGLLILSNLNENQILGEISFFTGLARTASAKTIKTSTLYKIDRHEFIKAIKQNQGDYEYFKMIQDKIIYSKSFIDIKIKCYSCQQIGHIAKYCPHINYKFSSQVKSSRNQQQMSQQRLIFNRQNTKSQNAKSLLKVQKQRNQTESEEQKSSNLPENDFYTFSQIKYENKFSNSQIVESPQKKRNLQQIKKRQNLKEQPDKIKKKSMQFLDQNGGDVFDEVKEVKSTFDQMQELDGQESQMKLMKSKSKNTSFLKNSITVDTCSISEFVKNTNTNTNSQLNFQQEDETINVTSNLISDFQIKDIQKIYKQLTNNQQQQNKEQFCNNFTNRCSIDSNNNLNCFQDMILNVNGQVIYDQTEYQNPSTIISANEVMNKKQSYKQLSRIDAFQQQVCLNQKNAHHDVSRKQNYLDNLIRSIFQKYDQSQSPNLLQTDSIQKFKYYFPMFNYDIVLKLQQKYIFARNRKNQESRSNQYEIKNSIKQL
ncbi:hypothetical protein ABPG72_015517 [Tetrahymena utriculariae]